MLVPATISKLVCVGRNYGAHAAELGNAIPESPLLFIKPASAVQPLALGQNNPVFMPTELGACHHELELTVMIGTELTQCTAEQARQAIAGIGLGLDLTLRDVQEQLKKDGHPWERAKAFTGSAPLTEFIPLSDLGGELEQLTFSLHRNGQLQQQGRVQDMLFTIVDLIVEIASTFSLQPGDVIFTGTPAGVSALHVGDELTLTLPTPTGSYEWQVAVVGR
ncbi:MAG: fumarylacetoacetate hydrolase family protein [Aliidiomarina sp.]|uniref:fumarylacetoacetate hydrolase family protein n=1 Tax=Aliidiomarina sp. TaxID=1872439 RepID=UPI0025C4DEE5|nr:fumarylacetoacetate hydrolase family protein [Aliidiomarina sp.]MCH8501509.1 fumarylacetoacetate hydrolase family protein [Aliidiomarina sp.]